MQTFYEKCSNILASFKIEMQQLRKFQYNAKAIYCGL